MAVCVIKRYAGWLLTKHQVSMSVRYDAIRPRTKLRSNYSKRYDMSRLGGGMRIQQPIPPF